MDTEQGLIHIIILAMEPQKKMSRRTVQAWENISPIVSTGKKSKGRKGKRKKDKSAGKQMSMSDYGYPGCGDDDYDDTDIHGGLSEYDDEYWRRRCGFDY